MASSPEISAMEIFSGRKSGKVAEKSNFAQTCSLLSQYLKENGNFGGLSRGVTGILEPKGRSEIWRQGVTTMNLLPSMEIPEVGGLRSSGKGSGDLKPLDFFPQLDLGDSARKGPETAQMTIFYAGKILVYNDFPADKAAEIMTLAKKGSSQETQFAAPPSSGPNIALMPSTTSAAPNMVLSTSSESVVVPVPPTQECIQTTPPQALGPADMPIARRKSLHRFLEKRKDRSTVRAPYPVMNNKPAAAAASAKPQESSCMAGVEAQPSEQQLDLKL